MAAVLVQESGSISDLSDETLLVEYREQGRQEAFAVLFGRYQQRATGYAWRLLRRREEAEEVCVEAFCRVVEGAWRPNGAFRPFLFTVVHRLCLDRLRRRSRGQRALSLLGRSRPGVDGGTPEDDAVGDERRRRLEVALGDLPELHRAAVLLYYGQELPSKEVAEVLGCSDQQLRSRLSYARKQLRRTLLPGEEA